MAAHLTTPNDPQGQAVEERADILCRGRLPKTWLTNNQRFPTHERRQQAEQQGGIGRLPLHGQIWPVEVEPLANKRVHIAELAAMLLHCHGDTHRANGVSMWLTAWHGRGMLVNPRTHSLASVRRRIS